MQDIGPPRNCLVPLNLTPDARPFQGMCALGDDMFATVENFDVMRLPNSSGKFVTTGQAVRSYWGIAAFNGDLYVGVRNVDVGRMTGGTGTWTALSWPARDWRAFATSTDGTLLYLLAYGYGIYTWNGTTLTDLGNDALGWHAIAPLGNDMLAMTYAGQTYKRTNNSGAFALVATTAHNFVGAANVRGTLYAGIASGAPVRWNGTTWVDAGLKRVFAYPRGISASSRGDLLVTDRNVNVYRMWGRSVPS